jgi:predicted metal-dependent hydrolase
LAAELCCSATITCARDFVANAGPVSFNRRVQFEFNWKPGKQASVEEFLELSQNKIRLRFVRHARARRYVLRLQPDGSARVTIPRRGSFAEARRFAKRNIAWLERALHRLSTFPPRPKEWSIGTEICFRGELFRIDADDGNSGRVHFGNVVVQVDAPRMSLRATIENHLWKLASEEFPSKVLEFAAAHGVNVRRITIRNQRSRWGSCSRRGTISLNWRLIQTPLFVRDYVILHELMHLREMNHSRRFWNEVERVCPNYIAAERWLKAHCDLLR